MTNKTDDGFAVTLDAPGYYSLAAVFERAFKQASEGKGKERHAGDGIPFDQQPMQTIARAHGVGFLTGQASKKAEEAHGLPHSAKIAELLGAMVYLAGAVVFLDSQRKVAPVDLEHHLGSRFMTSAAAVKASFVPFVGGGCPSKHAAMDRAGEVVAYCTRSGDKTRPVCGECKPYEKCVGI